MNKLSQEQIHIFLEKYRQTVAVPYPKGRQILLCPIGLVGAGKTTVMKPLAERLGLVRISGDEIRKMLKENGFINNRVDEIAFPVIESFLKEGYGVAVDSDCIAKREKIEKKASELNIPIVWIHIAPPEEFIINKLKNYPHSWLFKNADEAIKNYESRKPLHTKLDFNFVYTFDPSRPDINDQIDKAAEIIRNLP
ncbi:MAG TPA: AAA family ATPase [Candidatus Paceibacterota bacterium]